MELLIETSVQVAPVVAVAAVLAAIGGGVRLKWLLGAVLLVYFHDALLTNMFGLVPPLFGGDWNWTGKLLATAGAPGLRPGAQRDHIAPETRLLAGLGRDGGACRLLSGTGDLFRRR